jgi:hypothetical protein
VFDCDHIFLKGASLSNIEYDHECEHGPSLHISGKLLKYSDIKLKASNLIDYPHHECAEQGNSAARFILDAWYVAALPSATIDAPANQIIGDTYIILLAGEGINRDRHRGIMLLPCRDKGNGVYRRCGQVRFTNADYMSTSTNNVRVQEYVQAQQAAITSKEYHKKDDRGNYTIILI